MAVTAKSLSKTGAKGQEITELIKGHLQVIDDKLMRANHGWGRNCVAHEFTDLMPLSGIEKADVERIVYSEIILKMKERGFDVCIVLQPTPKILIAWTTEMSKEQMDAMTAVISKHLIRPTEEESFRQGRPRTTHTRNRGTGNQKMKPA